MSQRILIAGGPRTGKTYLADKLSKRLGVTPRHTDDLIGACSWSDASSRVAGWMDQPGPWVIEGVAVARAIRKWLAADGIGKPADMVYLGVAAREELTGGQLAMAKGCATVWGEVVGELRARGVTIETF